MAARVSDMKRASLTQLACACLTNQHLNTTETDRHGDRGLEGQMERYTISFLSSVNTPPAGSSIYLFIYLYSIYIYMYLSISVSTVQ